MERDAPARRNARSASSAPGKRRTVGSAAKTEKKRSQRASQFASFASMPSAS